MSSFDVAESDQLLMFAAIESGNNEALQVLIDSGADVNFVRWGDTQIRYSTSSFRMRLPCSPLTAAVERLDCDAVRILIGAGANPSFKVSDLRDRKTALAQLEGMLGQWHSMTREQQESVRTISLLFDEAARRQRNRSPWQRLITRLRLAKPGGEAK